MKNGDIVFYEEHIKEPERKRERAMALSFNYIEKMIDLEEYYD